MDDKKKHRLVGLAVIVTLFLIITPILIKNSRRHLSHKYVKLKLHPAIQKTQVILKTPKIAQLPALVKESEKVKTSSIEAIPGSVSETLPPENDAQPYSVAKQHSMVLQHAMAKQHVLEMQRKQKEKHVVLLKPEKPRPMKPIAKKMLVKPKTTPMHKHIAERKDAKKHAVNQKPLQKFVPHFMSEQSFTHQQHKLKATASPVKIKSSQYWIQVASLSNVKNAQKLVERLRIKGYKVYLKNITAATGEKLVKVMVVNSSGIEQAQVLRHKLAKEMKLNGVIVIA